ncbi:MAG: hypothetical protein KDJ14_07320 [Xanthomonadales bacterium]|nr:hypothetical protein [Xanthomonadales bacterium]
MLVWAGIANGVSSAPTGWMPEQTFADYSPLAAKWEYARRIFSPTTLDRLQRFERASGVVAVEHTVDLAKERFDLFVPGKQPEGGYGLLVFNSPMPIAMPLHPDWKRELSRRGIIWVSSYRSGNQQNYIERRLPLALHGYEHVVQHYPVNPERVYVGGFSGGSRVAERLAVAFSDVFRGVMLVGGADPIGEEAGPIPSPRELMRLFQTRTKVVFATGGEDLPNRAKDERSRENFERLCVAHVDIAWVPRIGHWVPDRRGLDKALDLLERPVPPVGAEHAACMQQLDAEVDAAFADVQRMADSGREAEAGSALGALEDRFGGLLPDAVVPLGRTLSAHMQQHNPSP